MKSFKDVSGRANFIYLRSLDLSALVKAEEEMRETLQEDWLNEANRASLEALFWRTQAKRLFLDYLADYAHDKVQKVEAFSKQCYTLPQAEKYQKTVALLHRVEAYVHALDAVARDYPFLTLKLKDLEGNLLPSTPEECVEIKAQFEKLLEGANELAESKEVFGETVVFPDCKAQFIKRIQSNIAFCERGIAQLYAKIDESFFRDRVWNLSEKSRLKAYEFYQVLSDDDGKLSNALILCTPYDDEARLFAVKNVKNVFEMQANAFDDCKAEALPYLFDALAQRKGDLLLFGLPEYHGENKGELLAQLIRLGRSGKKVFLVDRSGTRDLYSYALNVASERGFSPADVSYHYLSMPPFEELYKLLEDSDMVKGEESEREFVRENMPFLGFVGLNEITATFAGGGDWRKVGKQISHENAKLGWAFLKNLPTQSLFLDKGWGELTQDITDNSRVEFDYDELSEVDERNIRQIVDNSALSVFQKCGCVVRYCTLAGADKSTWTTLDLEEKSKRLTQATRLILRILGVGLNTEVLVQETLSVKGAGGLCVGGGKQILYRADCVQDYAWTIDAVCHESYHAFQHLVMYEAWRDWYWTDFGVTKGRKAEWINNDKKYVGIDKNKKAYELQVIESEARAFAKDCIDESATVWQTINFT